MIPRYQRVLFVVFVAAIVGIIFALAHPRRSTHPADTSNAQILQPAEVQARTDQATLMVASDVDDSLTAEEQRVPATDSANAWARVALQALFQQYSGAQSKHRLPAGPAVEDVFFVPLDLPALGAAPRQLAVVNFSHTFAQAHPSGLATEMLTLRSVIATLHANVPQVAAVRFLVDGRPAETLAGNANLQFLFSATEERDLAKDF